MARINRFSFRISEEEKRLLEVLAKHKRRSQSDTIRLLIIDAVEREVIADEVGSQDLLITNYENGSDEKWR